MNTILAIFGLISLTIVANPLPNGRIIGGNLAERGQFPYEVSLQRCYDSSNGTYVCNHQCGGAILTSDWILTAAQCFIEEDPDKYRIVAGIINLDDEARQVIVVEEIHLHPNYAPSFKGIACDIAVLKLSEPLSFNEQVQPIELPESDLELTGSATVAGWGLTQEDDSEANSNSLMYLELPIVETEVCHDVYEDYFDYDFQFFNATTNVCAGFMSGEQNACGGDSGSPLVQNGTVIGVVSWVRRPCSSANHPSVCARVGFFLDFVNEYVKN